MASYGQPNNIINRKAAADYSASTNLYLCMKPSSDTEVTKGGAGDLCVGFLNNLPESGQVAEINGLGGSSLAKAGGSVSVGNLVMCDANGAVVVATSGNFTVGIALQDAVSGDLFEVMPMMMQLN